jgi:hypothetical protein
LIDDILEFACGQIMDGVFVVVFKRILTNQIRVSLEDDSVLPLYASPLSYFEFVEIFIRIIGEFNSHCHQIHWSLDDFGICGRVVVRNGKCEIFVRVESEHIYHNKAWVLGTSCVTD